MPLTSPVKFAEVPPFPLDSATIEILQTGNERQQTAYKCIVSRKFFQILSEMRGVLASTITLGIDTPTSDLDFLCETSSLDRFSVLVKENFGAFDRFNTVLTPTPEISRCYSFWCDGFEIEIFGSLEPLEDQFGLRHYVATARLIRIGGDDFRAKLRDLKLHGIKTEPAIARILRLSGDPYQSVAALAELGDDELSRLFLQ
jgi:hypothetical protein